MKNARRKGTLSFNHKASYLSDESVFAHLIHEQENTEWVVYCKKPFAGPDKVIEYIGRYTHRVAISNSRIKSINNGKITIDYKDYRDLDEKGIPKHKYMVLTAEKFIRLFMLHVLPENFVKIRFYGILAGSHRKENIQLCRELLGLPKQLASLTDDNIKGLEWVEATITRLFFGEVGYVIGGLRRMEPKNTEAKEQIRKLIGYLDHNRKRIHYKGDRIGGYPIGSGGIESANKFICHTRMKRSGAWWVKETGNAMLRIRCAIYNKTYDNVFERYKKAHMAKNVLRLLKNG